MRYFAVGLNKTWVEVRTALTPPKEIKSKVVRKFVIPRGVSELVEGNVGQEVELVLKSVIHDGGRVILTIPRASFLYLLRKFEMKGPDVGAMCELPPKVAEEFKSDLAQKKWGLAD